MFAGIQPRIMSKARTTRKNILQKAFELVYRKGYQATSIDDIIATTEVTKGAFFYHFRNKEEMGLAIINEVMYPGLMPYMRASLEKTGDVRADLYGMMERLLLEAPFLEVQYGCPAVNLIEEMAPLSDTFRQALTHIIVEWQSAIEAAIARAQQAGQLDRAHDPGRIAMYITANYGGVRNMGKVFGSASYHAFLQEFRNYLSLLQ